MPRPAGPEPDSHARPEKSIRPALHLGTSGWSYPDWRERFYPAGLASRAWLELYGGQFNSAEGNMTLYRFPQPETLQAWLERTPPSPARDLVLLEECLGYGP